MKHAIVRAVACLIVGLLVSGCFCPKMPAQLGRLNEVQAGLLEELQRSHLGMIDSFVDERVVSFDAFFFGTFAPAYELDYREAFAEVHGREYDAEADQARFYEDMVAVYLELRLPLDSIREELKFAVREAHGQAMQINQQLGQWIDSASKLNEAQRTSIDRLLQSVDPRLSLDQVEGALDEALRRGENMYNALTGG